MITTIQFRLFPTNEQKEMLHEILTVYNRVKRIGYTLLFNGEQRIQQKLMDLCHNNPYVNTIIIENKAKLAAQKTWLKKQKIYLKEKIKDVKAKINSIKQKNRRDKRLPGLFSKISSLQNQLIRQRLKPIVFGTKKLFRDRILGKISKYEFKLRRDSSFSCIGKAQNNKKNLNLKILPSNELKIHRFTKLKGKEWVIVRFTVNNKQKQWLREISYANKYTVCVKRKLIKEELRYYAMVSYEVPASSIKYRFDQGAIGLDFNFDHLALTNLDKNGNLLSYQVIEFRNLNSYRTDRRQDYASYKLNKVLNYCINKKKGLVIEDLSFDRFFFNNRKINRKLSNLKTSMLNLLERKCLKNGVALRKVHPAYTSLIGKYKYSRSHNLSPHVLASYVIARRGLGFRENLPNIYKWVLSQVGEAIEPRLKKGNPYCEWAQIHDLFKHSGMTSFKTPEVMRRIFLMKDVLNSERSTRPDNLRVGLSPKRRIEDYHGFWESLNDCQIS